jgi:hypothetical protein
MFRALFLLCLSVVKQHIVLSGLCAVGYHKIIWPGQKGRAKTAEKDFCKGRNLAGIYLIP